MFRAKGILLTGLIILISSFLSYAQSYAQSRGTTNMPQKRFQISFGGGGGLYSMTKFNNYIDRARYCEMLGGHVEIDHIDKGPNLFGGFGYFVWPNVLANLSVTYLRGAGSYKANYTMTVYDYREEATVDTFLEEGSLTATLVAPELKIKYYFPIEKIDLFFSGGTSWCFGKCEWKSSFKERGAWNLDNSYKSSSLTAQGLGFLVSTGASYNINKTISFGAEIGYRYFATGDLKEKEDRNGEPRKVGTYPMEILRKTNLDFSGPFILGSLSIGL